MQLLLNQIEAGKYFQFFLMSLLILMSPAASSQTAKQVYATPESINWKPIVLTSVDAFNIAPPPRNQITIQEQKEIIDVQKNIDSATLRDIHYWNAGPPAYRWQRIADETWDSTQYWARNAYMHAAIYDATLAAWNLKYKHNRVRPFDDNKSIKALVQTALTPSFPCEHSVTAGAAATVLGYLYPSKKDSFLLLAKTAAATRIAAGVQYPSDVKAGFDLGVFVGQQVIERAKADGYDKAWAGTVPKGREYYTGKPLRKDLASMKPWVLKTPGDFRPPPPPPFEADMEIVKNFKADPRAMARAFRWEFSWPWGDVVDQKILEYNLTLDAPRAAFVYAVVSISDYENQLAHWDGKYTYFRARPDQYDSTYKALFPTPASPSYPAGHGTMAYTRAIVLSHLFPYDKDQFFAMAKEANESRFEAGVHYKSDNEAGEILGRKVGEEIVKWAKRKTSSTGN
jgi:membrane-associated phospholipid phosphatase